MLKILDGNAKKKLVIDIKYVQIVLSLLVFQSSEKYQILKIKITINKIV